MENTQNTIPVKQQAEAIQQVASGKPVTTTTKEKNPKRVAAGKKLAEYNRKKREEQQEGGATRGKLSLFATIFYTKPCLGRNTTIGGIHCIFE